MKLDEFKAWFEGFTESMEGAPTAKQWKRIKERVAEVDGAPVTERIPSWYPYWNSMRVSGNMQAAQRYNATSTATAAADQLGAAGCAAGYKSALNNNASAAFDSRAAMYSAGKAEALQ